VIPTYLTSKRLILCVADDQAILNYEQALLERSGYAVITAMSAEQALRLVTMCECDAVLLDCEMPVVSGYEVAFQIKNISPDLIIILLSGSEVPTHALVLVDAVVHKLDASRQLLPLIAELCAYTQDARQKQADVSLQIGDDFSRPSPRVFSEYDLCRLQLPSQKREEDS
jgi:CheY-like chemotaxis protein